MLEELTMGELLGLLRRPTMSAFGKTSSCEKGGNRYATKRDW